MPRKFTFRNKTFDSRRIAERLHYQLFTLSIISFISYGRICVPVLHSVKFILPNQVAVNVIVKMQGVFHDFFIRLYVLSYPV